MIVQKKGKIEIKDSIFKGLVNNEIKSTNWSGSINIINSSVKIKNILIKDSNAEDAINLVNSYGVLKNLKVENSSSDAIDIDFGNFEFENISCKNIKNDCLDVSGSTIKGKKLYGYEVLDKVLSSGEKSFVNINNVEILNSEIGLVSKDTSHVLINKAIFSNTKLHGAVFKKKQMFEGKTSLEILNHSKVLEDNLHEKFLVSLDSQLKINNKILPSNYSSKEIENKMYGNEYGN